MDSVPPELDLPFGDESSFKAWQAEATKAKPPNGVKPPPPPSDSDLPDANEQHLTAQLEGLLLPSLKDALKPGMLRRFTRGYTLRSFVNAPDRVERTAVMLNLTLQWRKEVGAAELLLAELPSRAEWDKLGPQCFPGQDADGRVIYYMLFPEDLTKIPLEEARMCHFQDMLRLEEVKAIATKERVANGLPERHHHVLILDLGNPNNAMSRSLLNWFKEVVAHPSGPSITQHFFPDMLERAVIINAPYWVRALWGFAKLFMDPATSEKYQITGGNYESTLADVGVPRSVLPMAIGGNGVNGPTVKTSVKVAKKAAEVVMLQVPPQASAIRWAITVVKGASCAATVTLGASAVAGGTGLVEEGATFAGDVAVPSGGSVSGGHQISVELKGSAAGSTTVSVALLPVMNQPWVS